MRNMMMNVSLPGMFSPASLFSCYASISAFFTLFQQAYYRYVPRPVQSYVTRKMEEWFYSKTDLSPPSKFTLVVEPSSNGYGYGHPNQVFEAVEKYLCTKLSSSAKRLNVSRQTEEEPLNYRLVKREQFKETFEDMEVVWRYVVPSKDHTKSPNNNQIVLEKDYFELSVDEEHKEKVQKAYLPHVLGYYSEIKDREKQLKLSTLSDHLQWTPVDFNHPFTFDSLAMDPDVKQSITDDLDRFVARKEFYKRVGKAWKRGYLLFGPPGTGKSSLVAAMANYLKFDIFDLQLSRMKSDACLRSLLLKTTNKSILVVEDIDCAIGLPSNREQTDGSCNDEYQQPPPKHSPQISLSGLLNFVDGLWSSCGDQRIIIFTTNHKARLDPALLRPGRMDLHIHMTYLTMAGFKVLARNYLDIELNDQHPLYSEIEGLLQELDVTAAQIAEEMMRNEDAEKALGGVIELLENRKKKPRDVDEADGEGLCDKIVSVGNVDSSDAGQWAGFGLTISPYYGSTIPPPMFGMGMMSAPRGPNWGGPRIVRLSSQRRVRGGGRIGRHGPRYY